MKTLTLTHLFNEANLTELKSVNITENSILTDLYKLQSKQIKKYFSNRKKSISTVFYAGDKVMVLSKGETGAARLLAGEIVTSDWDKAFGVHSPNGFINLKIKNHGFGYQGEDLTTWVKPYELFLLPSVN